MQMGIVPLNGLGVPGVYLTDMLIMLAITYLVVRRIYIAQIRYISLPADFFPLFLILALAKTGILSSLANAFNERDISDISRSLRSAPPRDFINCR